MSSTYMALLSASSNRAIFAGSPASSGLSALFSTTAYLDYLT
ncbi:hypothetical protein [Sporisorium scitamineum]|uniref:Uncharacterized protein n=1 Tax=Sporisorium scitamineum TaxID=49012 RepID=A0A0F7RXK1_9BASI|nr:hypothetical protein [Sporisorium scitamineum]